MRYETLAACVVIASLLTLALADRAAGADGWRADPEVVRRLSTKRPDIIYDEAKVPKYELPDALKSADGTRVSSLAQWPARRAEILELFRDQVFGRQPGRPDELRFEVLEDKPDALDGAATLRRVAIHSRQNGRAHLFELILFLPNGSERPAPVFVLINNRPPQNTDATREMKSAFWPVEAMIARGYGMATFAAGAVAPDDKEKFRDGVLKLFAGDGTTPSTTAATPPATTSPTTRRDDGYRALALWGWGASRVMDYLATDPRADAKRVAIVGHSRGGKASLWAGAEDERFALVVSNASGEGGASLSRRRFGETVGIITRVFPHWFAAPFGTYDGRENEMPFDQHMLIGLVAPRAVYVASGSEDLWADPRGEFLALAGASDVYALWGHPPINPDAMPAPGKPLTAPLRAYHIHDGPHDLGLFDWGKFGDFADTLWPRDTAGPRARKTP